MSKSGVILFLAVLLLSSCCGEMREAPRGGMIEAVGEVVSRETWERYEDDYLELLFWEGAIIVEAVGEWMGAF